MPEEEVTLYDFFRALIERTPWRTETEMRQFQNLIARCENVNLFGYMATKTSARKEFDPGRQGQPPALPPWKEKQ